MRRSTLSVISAIAAAALLAAAIFTENWIFYLLIACLVFAVSTMGRGRMCRK